MHTLKSILSEKCPDLKSYGSVLAVFKLLPVVTYFLAHLLDFHHWTLSIPGIFLVRIT